MRGLKGKTALVTSAGRGIGLACARRLAEEGAAVFLAVRRMEEAQALCDEGRGAGLEMTPVYFEASDEGSYASMVEEAVRRTGRLDVLVNNFGVGRPAEDLDVVSGSEEAFLALLRLNAGSVYRASKLAIPQMIQGGGGSIVNVSSIGGMIPDVSRVGYGTSKAAIGHLTRQIAVQYGRQGVRCNAVLPGLTATDAALRNMPETFTTAFLRHVPLGRMGTPEDVAAAVAFLAGDESSYITGHLLDIAGGYGITPAFS